MSDKPSPLIIEDGSCVDGANSYATESDGRVYWTNRFGGEMWDLSYGGDNHCDAEICKAYFGAIDYIRSLCFLPNTCPSDCLPNPIQCDCDAKDSIALLKEAQIILADAILKGWRPFQTTGSNSPRVLSVSSPDEGSVTFAGPVPLKSIHGSSSSNIGRDAVRRVHNILSPILAKKPKGRRVIT